MKVPDLGLITIVQPPNSGDGVRTSQDTRFFFADGSEFQNVSRCVVTFAVGEIVMATFDIAINPKENIEAHPMLSLKSAREAASYYGFELVKLPEKADGNG